MHEISEYAPTHQLKTIRPFFTDVWEGRKAFDIRKNDRDYKVGDILWLEEYLHKTGKYTNKVIVARVDYIVNNADLPEALYPGYVCMSITVLEKTTVDTFG
jgi:hypothetical protein